MNFFEGFRFFTFVDLWSIFPLLKAFISEFKFPQSLGYLNPAEQPSPEQKRHRKLSVAGRLGRGEKRGEGRSGGERKDVTSENVPPDFSSDPTDCPWVSEDGRKRAFRFSLFLSSTTYLLFFYYCVFVLE